MASMLPFTLRRFSGSTLEPSCQPVVLYDPRYYQKDGGRMSIKLKPTRCTPALKRAMKPAFITIPEYKYDRKNMDDDRFSAWSQEDDTSLPWNSSSESLSLPSNISSATD